MNLDLQMLFTQLINSPIFFVLGTVALLAYSTLRQNEINATTSLCATLIIVVLTGVLIYYMLPFLI